MSNYSTRKNFAEEIFADKLEDVISWIKGNLSPEEVFDEDQLEAWAKENVSQNFLPDKEAIDALYSAGYLTRKP